MIELLKPYNECGCLQTLLTTANLTQRFRPTLTTSERKPKAEDIKDSFGCKRSVLKGENRKLIALGTLYMYEEAERFSGSAVRIDNNPRSCGKGPN